VFSFANRKNCELGTRREEGSTPHLNRPRRLSRAIGLMSLRDLHLLLRHRRCCRQTESGLQATTPTQAMTLHHYVVVGRKKPTKTDPNPKVYRLRIFTSNPVVARSRFWYFLSQLKRVKKVNGQILAVHEVFERRTMQVKNYGFWLRYDSRSGTHNMYKEFRDITLTAACQKLYSEMASRHRARRSSIQIIRTAVVPASQVKRPNTLQFINSAIRFKLLHRVVRPSNKMFKKTFKVKRPTTLF